jgi:hypothetical protein
VTYINGDTTPIGEGGAGYCYECNFDLPLTGNDTDTLLIRSGPDGIVIEGQDTGLAMSCPFPYGMIVVNLRDAMGQVLTDNILFGELVVVDYASGYAYSMPAIPFQGGNAGNGDGSLSFDDQEFSKLPRVVAANFIAPNADGATEAISADLALFTLGFDRQFPPLTDCSITGYDAYENPFSASIQFGCWTVAALCDISPEFCYPNLGLYGTLDTHGWLQVNCRVDQDNDGTFDANGGVHGALVQTVGPNAVLARNDPAAGAFAAAAAWARLLHQSVTTGDPVVLHLDGGGGGLD